MIIVQTSILRESVKCTDLPLLFLNGENIHCASRLKDCIPCLILVNELFLLTLTLSELLAFCGEFSILMASILSSVVLSSPSLVCCLPPPISVILALVLSFSLFYTTTKPLPAISCIVAFAVVNDADYFSQRIRSDQACIH